MEKMEQNQNSSELEQMRSQLSMLKAELDQQALVNDKLMRASMRDRFKWVRNYIWAEIVVVPFAIALWALLVRYFGLSQWFTVVLAIGCVVDVALDWRVNLTPLKEASFERQNLVETARKLQRMKQLRKWQTIAGTVLVCLLLLAIAGAIALKLMGTFSWQNEHSMMLVGGIVGLLVGCCVGVWAIRKVYGKMQTVNDQILTDIQELTAEE